MDYNKNSEIVAAFPGKALNYIVVIKEIENENVTDYGFDVSNLVDKNQKYAKGIIVSMGENCKREDNGINEGAEVLYDKYKSSPLSVGGIEYKTLMFGDLVMAF